ncbi:MAG: DMT family transporter [Chloroflexi bacterium]|nr:DMT family transporter [Chloroflexota bacterium]
MLHRTKTVYERGIVIVGEYTGEFAGLATSFFWSFTSIFFTLSGRQVGSQVVNRTRLLLALGMVSLLHLVLQGKLLPVDAELSRWGWMGLSGLIGFVIGDAFLFQAFVMIGPRLAMLLMALNPVMGAIMAWALLNETLEGLEMLGIALAVSGVAWVVSERQKGESGSLPDVSPRYYLIGVLFGLGGALGQASGLIASKQGLVDNFPALSGNLMRLSVSTVTIWLIALATRQVRANFQALGEHPQAVRFILGGAIAGPFIGVWFSLIAVQNAKVGVASTLMSLTPVILLPLSRIIFKEHITSRAIMGTIVAVTGTTILFLA